MVKTMTIAAAIVAAASVLAFSGGALAQTGSANAPTQGDFDLCNHEAQGSSPGASTSGGSALPRTSSPRVGSPSTATPGSAGAGSSVSDSVGAGAATGGSTTGGSTLGSGSVSTGSSVSGDTQLRGIAAAGSNNSAYQSAYRDCMKRKGF